jgi:hypothetical protein
MGDNEISDDKNEGKLLAIFIAMAMQRFNTGPIAR